MPNILDAVVPRILAAGSVALRENAVMARLVRTDFSIEPHSRGKSVDVPIPSAIPVTDVVPSGTFPVATDLTPTFVPIQLTQWKESKFTLTDKEVTQIMEGYMPLQIPEAARSLANAIDLDLLNLYRDVYGFAGFANVTPFQNGQGVVGPDVRYDLGASRDARRVLNRQLCPVDNRRIVLDVDAEANATAITAFAAAYASADTNVITNGVIGHKQGFDWNMDQSVLRHNTGSTGTYIFTAAAAANVSTIAVTNGGGVPIAGDVFTIAGQVQPYVLRAGSTTTSWNISPPLRAAVPANTVITLVASHVANLAFHRDAFGLVMRPLDEAMTPGSIIETFVDDLTGIPLRLEITRQNKQTTYSFDVLYGVATIRAAMACRILG
jgi:P22 coat protein - gene protein 5